MALDLTPVTSVIDFTSIISAVLIVFSAVASLKLATFGASKIIEAFNGPSQAIFSDSERELIADLRNYYQEVDGVPVDQISDDVLLTAYYEDNEAIAKADNHG